VRTGASFGIAVFPDDAPDLESLCIAADLRMYENKRASGVMDEGRIPPAKVSPISQAKPKRDSRQGLQQ
jgi:GGDEF domain-containing protein